MRETPAGRRRLDSRSTLQEYRATIETERRIERVTEQLHQLAPAWRWAPMVAALQALRGASFITAVALVAELGDLTRFGQPRELMAYLGLVPSEYSSGPSVRRGAITKAGNPHARRLLAEAAWAYQGIPRIGRQHAYRQEALPKVVSAAKRPKSSSRVSSSASSRLNRANRFRR
jgi:transposase